MDIILKVVMGTEDRKSSSPPSAGNGESPGPRSDFTLGILRRIARLPGSGIISSPLDRRGSCPKNPSLN